MTWERVLVYNALAFALQMPLGVALDVSNPALVRCGFFLGTGTVAAAAFSMWMGLGGWGLLCVACMGNALFHLTAGKRLLEAHDGRSGPAGLFISTGALGLLAGRMGMEKAAAICVPVFAVALAACLAACRAAWMADVAAKHGRDARPQSSLRRDAAGGAGDFAAASVGVLVSLGLFALIVWRSWAALESMRLSVEAGLAFILCGVFVTWAGKAAGGYLAEWLGRWLVTAVSVCGSLALAFACSPESPTAWMFLLFTAQLATGPVLSLVYDRTRRLGGGTAFGVNCLGLFAGSL